MHSKHYESRKVKTIYILERREYCITNNLVVIQEHVRVRTMFKMYLGVKEGIHKKLNIFRI